MKRLFSLKYIAAIVLLLSCHSTKVVNSWRDPETQVSLEKLSKVLVVAFFKDEPSRRAAEDQIVSELQGKGVASYNYFVDNKQKLSEEEIRNQLKNDGFDGAIAMRLVDVDKEVNYTPGRFTSYPVYYRTFGGYYVRGSDYYSTPERYQTTHSYSVETNVYSLKQDKLIWSGLTETTDPSGVDKLTSEISKTIYKKMVKEGFIAK